MYQGDRVKRDGAYHQGTVWSWLMGPFVTASVSYTHLDVYKRQVLDASPMEENPFGCSFGSLSLEQGSPS